MPTDHIKVTSENAPLTSDELPNGVYAGAIRTIKQQIFNAGYKLGEYKPDRGDFSLANAIAAAMDRDSLARKEILRLEENRQKGKTDFPKLDLAKILERDIPHLEVDPNKTTDDILLSNLEYLSRLSFGLQLRFTVISPHNDAAYIVDPNKKVEIKIDSISDNSARTHSSEASDDSGKTEAGIESTKLSSIAKTNEPEKKEPVQDIYLMLGIVPNEDTSGTKLAYMPLSRTKLQQVAALIYSKLPESMVKTKAADFNKTYQDTVNKFQELLRGKPTRQPSWMKTISF